MTTTNTDLQRDIGELRKEVGTLTAELALLRRALIGSYDSPGGMAVLVQKNTTAVKEHDGRISTLERWREQLTNRAVGVLIGLSLGSAGVGGAVAAVVSNLLAP